MTALIRQLNEIAPSWGGAMWRAIWQGGLAIAVVWTICLAWPRLSARVRCWLWRLAFAKLLVSFLCTAPIKLALLPAAKPAGHVAAQVGTAPERGALLPLPDQTPPTGLASLAPQQGAGLALPGALAALWACGVAAGLWGLARQWRLARRLVLESRNLDHPQIEADLLQLSSHLGIRSLPEVRLAESLSTPLLAGLLRPVILVPQAFLDQKSPEQLRMMLAHELAHIKRRDLSWGWLALAARLLFFFHPLVLLAKKESRLTDEMAADELTVTACQLRTVDYAGMLVEVAAGWLPLENKELVVGVVGSHQTLRRRLQAMKYIKSMSTRRIMAVGLVITTIGLGAITPWRVVAQEPSVAPRAAGAEDQSSTLILLDAEGRFHFEGRVMAEEEIVSAVKTAADNDPKSVIAVQADDKAPFHQCVVLLDKLDAAGIRHVSLATTPHLVTEPQPFDIAFGVWQQEESKQTGPAAAGSAGDYWNTVGVPWVDDHTESNLKFTAGGDSPIQVRMMNLAGGWGNDGKMGVKDPMMDSYNYPVNNQGGNSHVILTQVPAGRYDIYIYGHEIYPAACGDYTLTVGRHNYGRKVTSNKSDAIENTTWVEGSQYVKYSRVKVGFGDKVEILIQPGGQVTDHWGRTFADAAICGLQLIPAP